MPNPPDYTESVNQVYTGRNNFILIGLTGRTGSGCSSTADILAQDMSDLKLPKPYENGLSENELRKYRIVYNFTQENWNRFEVIKVTNLITSFLFEFGSNTSFFTFIDEFIEKKYPKMNKCHKDTIKNVNFGDEFEKTYYELEILKDIPYSKLIKELSEKTKKTKNTDEFDTNLYEKQLPAFKKLLKNTLNKFSPFYYTSLYQTIGDNIRGTGSAIKYSDENYDSKKIFTLADEIDWYIKKYQKKASESETEKKTYIVIDCLRNPFEALYFREKYSAFYLMALNTPDNQRVGRLHRKLNLTDSDIFQLDEKEYNGKKQKKESFISQDIQKCYDIADIHIHNPQIGENDFSQLKKAIATYISLIQHPGLITPTSVERCMQIAHVSKNNSGCLSRKVGAVITDKDFSIKAVGWNDVPKGQTPCILRNMESLLNHDDKIAYSDYEKNDCRFRKELEKKYSYLFDDKYEDKKKEIKDNLRGRNISFCLKISVTD
jgi:dCMP deaminase